MVGLAAIGGVPVLRLVITGHDGDPDMRVAGLDLFCQLEAIFSRQLNIHENEIGNGGFNLFQSLFSVTGLQDLDVPKPGVQRFLQDGPEQKVIIYDQYLMHPALL